MRASPIDHCLIDVFLIGASLRRVSHRCHLIDVSLISAHLIDASLIGVLLTEAIP
jgi:hypothetical protein